MAQHAGDFLAVLLLGVMSIRGRTQELWARWAEPQTISCVLTTRLSSVYAPIFPLAFVLALVCVAFAFKEPEDES
jgi:hypothetical protein